MSYEGAKLSIHSFVQGALKSQEQQGAEKKNDNVKLKKACQDFEAVFIKQVLSSMRNASEMENSLFGNGYGGEMFQDLFDTEIARSAASGGGYGLSEQLYRQLSAHLQKAEVSEAFNVQVQNAPSVSARQLPERFEREVSQAAKTHNLDPDLIYAVIQRESNGRVNAVSPKGAKGLMQLMDATARELGVTEVFDAGQNIEGGARYLRQMLDRHDGDIKLALAAYNAGPGNVARYGGIPPFRETQNYVEKVIETYDSLKSAKDEVKIRNV